MQQIRELLDFPESMPTTREEVDVFMQKNFAVLARLSLARHQQWVEDVLDNPLYWSEAGSIKFWAGAKEYGGFKIQDIDASAESVEEFLDLIFYTAKEELDIQFPS